MGGGGFHKQFQTNTSETEAYVSPEGEIIIALPAFPAVPSFLDPRGGW